MKVKIEADYKEITYPVNEIAEKLSHYQKVNSKVSD